LRPRLDSRAAALLLGLALLAAAPPARAQEAEPPAELPEELRTIESVRYRGLRAISPRQLLKGASLRTRRPSALPWRDRPTLRRDYLRADSTAIVGFYRHYGYLDARVRVVLQPSKDGRSTKVVFEVTEGPRTTIERVDLAGVTAYTEKELRRSLLSQPRVPFDPAFLQLDTLRIKSLYRERGYFVGVRDRAEQGSAPAKVIVGFEVTEGPRYRVGEVAFESSGKVREALGRRELLLRPGDVYRQARLTRSVERLYGTGLYRQVQVSSVLDSAASEVDLRFRLSERKSRWVDGGVGSGTTDRFRVSGTWGHRNLDTRALAGALDGEYSLDGTGHFHKAGAGATLTEPWLLGVRLLGQAGVFTLREDDRSNPSFIRRRDEQGITFTLFRELSRLSRATLVQSNRFVHQDFDTLPGGVVLRPDTLRATYRTNSLRLTLERDLRDNRISPVRGSYQIVSAELAGGPLRGTSSYRKLLVTSTWYSPLSNGWSLAARAMGGVMEPFGSTPANFSPTEGLDPEVARVPFESRFFLGGVNSLRGYAENAVPPSGGLALGLANVEVRIPLAGPFGVEAFVDVGNVWARPEYIRASNLAAPWQAVRNRPDDLRWTYGVGARLVLPFGPLRVDVAWNDRPDFPEGKLFGRSTPFVYQFAIGPSF
jgi:outer membrane protein insertion porin family